MDIAVRKRIKYTFYLLVLILLVLQVLAVPATAADLSEVDLEYGRLQMAQLDHDRLHLAFMFYKEHS